ncbi:uncharacterized protein LOC141714815 [Apium graveolens]|uniref:uncharacterized protein LOC141714815 n=1 Tax=Apium graveolens TaxID=4045 RepID=UPI003D78EE7E
MSAEIPDPLLDPVGYAAVKEFMIHGPCGLQNVKSPCMKYLRCIRHFPKNYCAQSTFDDSGFQIYMRRRINITVEIRKTELDNQWVVPYNRDLLVKYQCHMNVEICCHAHSLKYLFKYYLKGHDRATVQVQRKRKRQPNDSDEGGIDEIMHILMADIYVVLKQPIGYLASLSIIEVYLLRDFHFTYQVTKTAPSVPMKRLVKLLPGRRTSLVNWKPFFKTLLMLMHGSTRMMRFQGFMCGMMVYGATSFESLRTVNGVCYSTFRDACKEYCLLDDDKEQHEVLTQASAGGLPPQIRQLFVHIIVNCKVTDLKTLWSTHWKSMVDDILLGRHKSCPNTLFTLKDTQLQFYALGEIDELLRLVSKSLKKFDPLPQPPRSYLNNGTNHLIIEETRYDTRKMEYEATKLLHDCTEEQRKIYNALIQSIDSNIGGIFFVYYSGGCGKTFLWRTLICKLRSESIIVLLVASSGIAATLMPGGRTAHSRFKNLIVLDECSTCNIAHNSDIAQLIKQTQLIIWDEAPMQHRYAFKYLDRSLKDIMKSVDQEHYNMLFGGITVILGGDFRQILPVITYGDRADIVAACITRSRLWSICQVFLLTENMRLKQGESDSESEELKKFAKWVIDIGNGQVSPPRVCNLPLIENQILIPSQFCDVQTENTVDNMICSMYPNFSHESHSTQYLSERVILTPTNQTVGHLNSLIVDKLQGESVSYFSVDAVEEFGGTDEDLTEAFPVEYLNSLNVAGMPPHDLKLKVGVVVMVMRNLNQTLGLCNGTRMIVAKCLKFCVECEVICGTFVGSKHFIPRIEISPSYTKMPFKLVWKQMPLQICYAMTINKYQGQSLKTVGLYLPKSVLNHGQYYIAISRVTSPTGLTIFVDDESGAATNLTQNVVYKEVFYDLPKA